MDEENLLEHRWDDRRRFPSYREEMERLKKGETENREEGMRNGHSRHVVKNEANVTVWDYNGGISAFKLTLSPLSPLHVHATPHSSLVKGSMEDSRDRFPFEGTKISLYIVERPWTLVCVVAIINYLAVCCPPLQTTGLVY